MKQTVKIGDQEVEMLATAATDIYFNMIFHEDSIQIQTAKNLSDSDVFSMFCKLGFVMAMQAKYQDRQAMTGLTVDHYIEWMDQFDHHDYIDAVVRIRILYEGQKIGGSKPKKTEDQ